MGKGAACRKCCEELCHLTALHRIKKSLILYFNSKKNSKELDAKQLWLNEKNHDKLVANANTNWNK